MQADQSYGKMQRRPILLPPISRPSQQPCRLRKVIDVLRQSVPKSSRYRIQKAQVQSGKQGKASRTRAKRRATSVPKNEGWLKLAPDRLRHVRRWKDFNYPVLRVALKNILNQIAMPWSQQSRDEITSWPRTGVSFSKEHKVQKEDEKVEDGKESKQGKKEEEDDRGGLDHRTLTELGTRLNECLVYATIHRSMRGKPKPTLRLEPGHTEQTEPFGGDPENDGNEGTGNRCTLRMDWSLRTDEIDPDTGENTWAVVGVNRTEEEFSLSALENSARTGAPLDADVDWTIRQVGTVCFYKGAAHGFVLTPAGAALLLFSQTLSSGNPIDDPASVDERGHLCVRWVTVPWTLDPGDRLGLPLLMGLWSLCMVALSDDDEAQAEGVNTLARLNSWHWQKKYGSTLYTHCLFRQGNRGHPPGALIWGKLGDGDREDFEEEKRNGRVNGVEEPLPLVHLSHRGRKIVRWDSNGILECELDSPPLCSWSDMTPASTTSYSSASLPDTASLPSREGSPSGSMHTLALSPIQAMPGIEDNLSPASLQLLPHTPPSNDEAKLPMFEHKTYISPPTPSTLPSSQPASENEETTSPDPVSPTSSPPTNNTESEFPSMKNDECSTVITQTPVEKPNAMTPIPPDGPDKQWKRKRDPTDIEGTGTLEGNPEPWSRRLRPRTRRPDYRDGW
ncbi:uncharacterized protein BCR38DRAFT_435746 [Pseudomassariella vexata]|uniref:Uncharacterized protein n=1 Tax=Pseudomassariella vexata TaxID=1141098 RepID=A0A1Y2DUV9_9PEZI|nr:uncharacterized protein BCR38DRAFT_435746 [Pseudomassariella vexata]ORY63051.1 hypothetical protein BCR38DRAFT_435746 [Pseudomassariella vexata]